MILVIDHYDSFIDMICDYLLQLGYTYQMVKTDQLTYDLLTNLNPSHIIIGPGPGHPEDFSLHDTFKLLANAISNNIPVLGICLGHQIIASYFGAQIEGATFIAHGTVDSIIHSGTVIFNRLPSPMRVTRYHSLLIGKINEESPLRVLARTERNEIMAVGHSNLPVYGVQFHPESIMSEFGLELFANFLNGVK